METIIPAWTQKPLEQYLALLDRWSRTHALTSLEKDERFEELIQDSAVLLPFLTALPPQSKVVDFGTGMGIPAVVLALARPDLIVVALDKSHKKIAFVRQVAMELKISNLLPLAGRAEDLAPLGAQLGVAKAVGSLELLAGWWGRHRAPGAPFLALKGPEGPFEAPGGYQASTHPYSLPTRGNRVLVKLV